MAEIVCETFDDLLRKSLELVRSHGNLIRPTKGVAKEVIGASLKLTNPLARFSRTESRGVLYSAIGETLWYVSGSNEFDFIEHYIPTYRERCRTPKGVAQSEAAYGPRLKEQMPFIINAVQKNDTRKAVISIYREADSRNEYDVPCTCTLQFFPRSGVLHALAQMRSNDIYTGMAHDVFAFTMLQEFLARSTGLVLGSYTPSRQLSPLRLYTLQSSRWIASWVQGDTAMNLSDPVFHDDNAARAYMEAQRWANGVVCPHCGGIDKCKRLEGAKHRPGLFQCGDCRKQFTVTVGTVFERSKVFLSKWMLATHLMASSKKGFSAHQLHRSIGLTYKTAWFMWHRICEAMTENTNFGAGGGTVEVDETFIGREPGKQVRRGVGHKMKDLTLVDRTTGHAKSIVVDDLKVATLLPILRANMAAEATVHTDEAMQYDNLSRHFANHESVNHGAEEYVRGDVTTNTVEGYFSIFKRGMKGVYQHCEKQHLHRYAAEFAFRYSNRSANQIQDTERAALIVKGAEGKRLTYRRPDARA